MKWILILAILQVGFCQDKNGGYQKILLNGFENAGLQGDPSSAGILSAIGQFIQLSPGNVVKIVTELLTGGLEDAASNFTSVLCLNHTELFIEALIRRENWALRMVDAFGKPKPGLMDYSFTMMGNYDECIAIQADRYADPATKQGLDHPYTGKYCTGHIQLTQESQSVAGPLGASIGMCLPDTCSDKDGSVLMNIVAAKLFQNITLPTLYMTCQEKSLEFTDKAKAASIVGAFFAVIILFATAYDVIIQHFLQKQSMKYDKGSRELNGIDNKSFNVGKEESSNGDQIVGNGNNMTNGSTKIDKHAKEKSIYKPGILGKLLLSFSVYSNAPKILNTNQPKGTLTCVNGIRFLSMSWVILGHTISFLLNMDITDNLATYLPKISKRFTFQAIMNATVSVDTFFVLSGLLVSYLSLKEMKKRGGASKFNWLLFYFHRFWRLTPPYMLLMLLYVPTFKYWSDGPLWVQQGVEIEECKDTWWTNILYINNLYMPDKQCMGWSWYLANDMQFYVISPLMLIPLFYNDIQDIADNLYITPWTRVGPYVVGFFLGYVLYKTECKVKMSKIVNMAGWTVATAMAISVLYGLYTPDGNPPDLSNGVSALYNATSRTAWGISVAWVIFACSTGYGGFVNTLLSWQGIIPLSRLTYCAYLVHPIVISLQMYTRRTPFYFTDLEIVYLFLGHLCVSYAAAFVLSLAFESPMMGLEKVLLGRKKHS